MKLFKRLLKSKASFVFLIFLGVVLSMFGGKSIQALGGTCLIKECVDPASTSGSQWIHQGGGVIKDKSSNVEYQFIGEEANSQAINEPFGNAGGPFYIVRIKGKEGMAWGNYSDNHHLNYFGTDTSGCANISIDDNGDALLAGPRKHPSGPCSTTSFLGVRKHSEIDFGKQTIKVKVKNRSGAFQEADISILLGPPVGSRTLSLNEHSIDEGGEDFVIYLTKQFNGFISIITNGDAQTSRIIKVIDGKLQKGTGTLYLPMRDGETVELEIGKAIDSQGNDFKLGDKNLNQDGIAVPKGTPNSTSTSPIKGGIDECQKNNPYFGWIICPIVKGVQKAVKGLWDQIANLLKTEPISSTGAEHQGWAFVRTFTLSLLGLALLLIIFGQTFGLEAYTIQKALPRLIAVAILIPFSFVIGGFIVDIGNVSGQAIKSLPLPQGDPITYFGSLLAFSGGTLLVIAGSVLTQTWPALVLGVISLLFSILSALVTLVLRKAIIIAFVVFSPIIAILWVLPFTEKYAKMALEMFIRVALMYPLIMAVFAGSSLLASVFSGKGDPFIVLLLLIGSFLVIPYTFKWAGGIMGAVAGGVSALGGKISGGAQKALAPKLQEAALKQKAKQIAAGKGLKGLRGKVVTGIAAGTFSRAKQEKILSRATDEIEKTLPDNANALVDMVQRGTYPEALAALRKLSSIGILDKLPNAQAMVDKFAPGDTKFQTNILKDGSFEYLLRSRDAGLRDLGYNKVRKAMPTNMSAGSFNEILGYNDMEQYLSQHQDIAQQVVPNFGELSSSQRIKVLKGQNVLDRERNIIAEGLNENQRNGLYNNLDQQTRDAMARKYEDYSGARLAGVTQRSGTQQTEDSLNLLREARVRGYRIEASTPAQPLPPTTPTQAQPPPEAPTEAPPQPPPGTQQTQAPQIKVPSVGKPRSEEAQAEMERLRREGGEQTKKQGGPGPTGGT